MAYLLASIGAFFLPAEVRRGAWLPLHLALAGAATSAIAGIMPYFTAAFAAAPPRDSRLRMAALGAVALGALGVSVGVVGGQSGLAAAGGVAFIAGIGLTGVAAIRPLGQGLGPSRGLVTQGYVIALAEVGLGASVATLFVHPLVAIRWGLGAHYDIDIRRFLPLLPIPLMGLVGLLMAFGVRVSHR